MAASVQSGRLNSLASPREFGSPKKAASPRKMVTVFAAGTKLGAMPAPDDSPKKIVPAEPPCRVPRDPRCPQSQNALWDPTHDWTKPDNSDAFAHRAGGVEGVITTAGHNRIKKRTNAAEVDFYSQLSEPSVVSLAPKFCGSHTSNGNDWDRFVILEDLTTPFRKPNVLDVQISQQHAGGGEPGTCGSLGLRLNGMRRYTNTGVQHNDKVWGGTIGTKQFHFVFEEFITDAAGTRRLEVLQAVLSFLDQVEEWMNQQQGLSLPGSSLLIIYEGDTEGEQAPPVVKMVDFAHAERAAGDSPDKKYLVGIHNLRWMIQRLHAFCEIGDAKGSMKGVRDEVRAARAALRDTAQKCDAAAQQAKERRPPAGGGSSKLLHEDIIRAEVSGQVEGQEDNVIAGFLRSVLAKHKINPGTEAFVELLQWRMDPLIMDRSRLNDIFNTYGLASSALDDVLKWKETSDVRLREMRYVFDVKLSGSQALPSFQDALIHQEAVQAILMGSPGN